MLPEVAFVWGLTEETIILPLGCLQGGMRRHPRPFSSYTIFESRLKRQHATLSRELALADTRRQQRPFLLEGGVVEKQAHF